MPSYETKSKLGKEMTRNIRESNQNARGNQDANVQYTDHETEWLWGLRQDTEYWFHWPQS